MTLEISPEELRLLPGYEIRAQVFMAGVEEFGKDLCPTVEDEDKRNRKESNPDKIRELEEFIKVIDPNWVHPKYRKEMVVRIYTSTDSYEPLKEFIDQTLDLARRQGGRIDHQCTPITDKLNEDLIVRHKEVGGPYFITELFFLFDENLPGSI